MTEKRSWRRTTDPSTTTTRRATPPTSVPTRTSHPAARRTSRREEMFSWISNRLMDSDSDSDLPQLSWIQLLLARSTLRTRTKMVMVQLMRICLLRMDLCCPRLLRCRRKKVLFANGGGELLFFFVLLILFQLLV
ncbi:hypothetical protein LINPERHAP1_LOCUS18260 [Linum perenne]